MSSDSEKDINDVENQDSAENAAKIKAKSDGTRSDARIVRDKKPGLFRFRNVAAVAILGVFGATAYNILAAQQQNNGSRLSRGQNIDATPAGRNLETSQRYRNTLQQANEDGAKTATTSGASFLATPDEPLRDIDQKPKEAQKNRFRPLPPVNDPIVDKPQTVVIRERRNPTPSNLTPVGPDYGRINELAQAMLEQQSAIVAAQNSGPSEVRVVIDQDLYTKPEKEKPNTTSNNQNRPLSNQATGPALIKAGDVVLASTLVQNDSDNTGPVVAELRRGPLKGVRLIGQLEKDANNAFFIIKFQQGFRADGTPFNVDAYAVDARNRGYAVRTDIDRRLLARYAPRVAATFITGAGAVLANTGSTVVGLGDGSTGIASPAATFRQGVYGGLAKIGEDLSDEFVQNAPKGPLIRLGNRQIIGVMFLNPIFDQR